MESVEIWMWIVAGLLLGGLLFGGAYTFFSRYLAQQEKNQAFENFEDLELSVSRVCLGGSYDKISKNYILPFSVEKLYVADEDGSEGSGNQLCLKLKEEDAHCLSIKLCSASMQAIDLSERTGLFYLIQKALGKKMVANIRFTIYKMGPRDVVINWTREYVK
ncbi:MAG: hypothetical protein QW471_02390 [Candidatus Woesearchaeota archaeon]